MNVIGRNNLFKGKKAFKMIQRSVAWILKLKETLWQLKEERKEFSRTINQTEKDPEKQRTTTENKPLNLDDLVTAESEIIQFSQRLQFREEIKALQKSKQVSRNSQLFKLDPILQDLRVGQRLNKSAMPENAKHQAILSKHSKVATLILRDIHQITGHCGRSYVLAQLRCKYWIPQANSAIRRLINKCLIQSMEMLRLLGVTKVVVYKTSCNAHTQKVLDYYESTGFMDVIAWPLSSRLNVSRGWQPAVSPGQLHYYGQVAALNDCMYRYMYLSRYIGLHDIDEIIIPQAVDSWKDLMPLLEQTHKVDRGYMFENFVFPISIFGAPPTHAGHQGKGWPQVEGVNILDHLYYEPLDTQSFHNFKILVNPRAVRITSVHGLPDSAHGCVRVPSDVARMHHTRAPVKTGLKPEELTFDGRLLDYRDRLVPAVNAVLEKSGLLQPDPIPNHEHLTLGD
ncbi:hypothetical protein N1851_010295 [Merluccius polli]|uniref:Glycosyltransferase family 92 protein n=1 Tax=Merluccius polli TaxID=89951 RepID=A0AA47MZZ1_MERPO|nr:hypothetical protein N1851_010295 [Merluccius polli]